MSLDSQAANSIIPRIMLPTGYYSVGGAVSGAGNWIDTADIEGTILVVVAAGAINGSVIGKLQTALDANGTGAADLVGAVLPSLAANSAQTLAIPKSSVAQRYLGFVGTIVTGPAVLTAIAMISLKYK